MTEKREGLGCAEPCGARTLAFPGSQGTASGPEGNQTCFLTRSL